MYVVTGVEFIFSINLFDCKNSKLKNESANPGFPYIMGSEP